MKRAIGLTFTLIGAVLMIAGILGAGGELKRLYADTLERPLDAEQADGTEVSATMLRHVAIGVGGAPLFLIGLVMFKSGRPRVHTP